MGEVFTGEKFYEIFLEKKDPPKDPPYFDLNCEFAINATQLH